LSVDRTRLSGYFLAGAVAFATAQAVLFLAAEPPARRAIDGEGWFLNSGTGIAVMTAVLVAASLVVSRALPGRLWQRWGLFVGGGVVALVGAVFLFGPGTIFPLVIVTGAVVIAVAALAGAWGARLLD
jgi:hypothetical protein